MDLYLVRHDGMCCNAKQYYTVSDRRYKVEHRLFVETHYVINLGGISVADSEQSINLASGIRGLTKLCIYQKACRSTLPSMFESILALSLVVPIMLIRFGASLNNDDSSCNVYCPARPCVSCSIILLFLSMIVSRN